MARNTKKMGLMVELEDALGVKLPDGAYFSQEAAREMITMLKGPKKSSAKKKEETEDQIHKRIMKRFDDLGAVAEGTIAGAFRGTIISGPPGLGKSYSVEEQVRANDPNGINTTTVSGKMSPVGLFKQLWDHREEGQILVIDDCDSVFYDDTSMNLLKAAIDTQSNKPRMISYLSESQFVSEKDGSPIDKRFEFNGTIIFITNYDFDELIARGHRLAPHFEALKSRAMYISLELRSRKDYMVRVKQIANLGLFDKAGGKEAQKEVIEFMQSNLSELDEVSARMAIKIANIRKAMPQKWKGLATVTCFRKEQH